MAKYVIAYFVTLIVFLAVDSVWLALMANRLYKPTLGDILLPNFLVAPAAIFYALFVIGVVIFSVAPALQNGQWTTALVYGALFGFFSYGVYDFTNMSTLRNWTATITIADLCWGTFLTGLSATLGTIVTEAIAKAVNIG